MKINASSEQTKYEVVDGKYEYKKIPLEGHQSELIFIPMSIVLDTNLDLRRIGIFSYLRIRRGLDDVVGFTASDIVEWCGGKPDRKANGSNGKVLSVLDNFNECGYITYLTEQSRSSYMKCAFNRKYYGEQCSKGYAVVYVDEINAIMNYQKENVKDGIVNNFIILLVFAYLRHKIIRRKNKLKPEERFPERVKERRQRCPEAYYSNISDMANELGISYKTLSKIIDILECDLHLIVTDCPYRIKNEDDEFRTLPTIFANTYKREDKFLLDVGKEYSRDEIELKAEKIRQRIKSYQINKTKRK